ncbi:MAG TPA: D-serine ammonia-lyase [Bacillota bacterium]|nr:D-serine ammonia-lyase [Bacillota bacterium]
MVFSEEKIEGMMSTHPVLQKLRKTETVVWINSNRTSLENANIPLSNKDVFEAEQLLRRFQPFFEREFGIPLGQLGMLESPLEEISSFHAAREDAINAKIPGKFYLKCDNDLPIAGSIKARGGFYEVLQYAESLALDAGMIKKHDDYALFASDSMKKFFNQYSIGVASTGNLGLSIGIMSAKLGFQVSVHMSHDAKRWKKELLREKGAHVYEYDGDFGNAIEIGREQTNAQPNGYFVDDEDSKNLFLGYSTAASGLKKQLDDKGITIDREHPLFLYLPCGVGGSPGGITFGAKQLFGDHVHCFFVEPTHSPSVLLGLETGLMNNISVHDIGLDNVTEADGLAVGRPSGFATKLNDQLISGIYTIKDDTLYALLAQLADKEGIYVEPSATAGLLGPEKILQTSYLKENDISPENITHIAWSTGGSMVPAKNRQQFYEKGHHLLKKGYFHNK